MTIQKRKRGRPTATLTLTAGGGTLDAITTGKIAIEIYYYLKMAPISA